MSYKVDILHSSDSGSGVSVEARVEGEAVAHTFPKGMGFFEEPVGGRPPFVEKLIEKYENKKRRAQKISVQETTTEESKIHSGYFDNKTYGENFKQEDNLNSTMTNVDLNDSEEIRDYLKENMAEGYLSEEEGMNIDEFVDRYEELLETKENFEKIIREVQEDRV